MCGIAGVYHFSSEPAQKGVLQKMIETLHHRGPDGNGVHTDGNLGLAHSRLSIIDLSAGHQPMANVEGDLWITFNGEIFNYIELRADLEKKGRKFKTHSDTEVILQLYAEKGEECVKEMNGQWAFAIWDSKKRKLFLSRDRAGVRPLFHTSTGKQFLFGSEIKAIFAHPEVKREIDPAALDQIFTYWHARAPRTFFAGIDELPPGHSMTVEAGGQTKIWPYWQYQYPVNGNVSSFKNEDEAAEKLREILIDATRIRLRADVPVGAYLSGGLDSTVTTSLIRNFTNNRLHTFSVSFEDPEFDESSFQKEAVRRLDTEHREVRCSYDDIGRIFPDVIWHAETPVLRTAPAPLFLLSKLVRENNYKVVLTGEGSDEMLGGYDIFKEAKIRRFWASQPGSKFRHLLLKRLYPYLPNLQSQSDAYLKEFFHVTPQDLGNPFFSHVPRWDVTSKAKVFFSKELQKRIDGRRETRGMEAELPKEFSGWNYFNRSQYLEASGLLPGYILSSQGDRMAMANSVEGRFPFLDYRLMEFAAKLPVRFKMKGLNEKYLLKKSMKGLIPESIQKRPKQPYRAPEARSFFNGKKLDYVEELLSPEQIKKDGLFNPNAVAKLVQKSRESKAVGVKDNMALVGILSTQLVVNQYINHFGRRGDVA